MKKLNGKVITFFRRNAVYLVLALCIIAVGLSMTLVIVNRNTDVNIEQEKPPIDDGGEVNPPIDNGGENNGDDSNENPNDTPSDTPGDETPSDPVVSVVSFIMPVDTENYKEYSETMVWNSTLGRFSSHTAMDFFAEEGTSVFAVYDGTVESVESTFLKGVTIVIDHGDGLKTVYNSLVDGDSVTVGQEVSQGDVIGAVSVSNRQEYKEGAHLHFEVVEDGSAINPLNYLNLAEK